MPKNTEIEQNLAQEVRALRLEAEKLNKHRFIQLHNSLWKLGFFQLFRGLAFGLGSVLGATLLVSVLAFILGSIDFVPILGDWAKQVLDEIQTN